MSKIINIKSSEQQEHLNNQSLPFSVGEPQKTDIWVPGCTGVAGYIGEAEGHLFFQPALTDVPSFHNNYAITSSVWIKSGDEIRIGSQSLKLSVHGDQYNFSLTQTENVTATIETHLSQNIAPPISQLPLTVEGREINNEKPAKKWFALLAIFLLTLGVFSLFTLFAQPVHLNITPTPDSIHMKGAIPVIKLGDQFMGLKGEYTITAIKEGYSDLQEKIIVSKEQNSFSFTLKKLPGILTISSLPVNGANVFINGESVGVTPLNEIETTPGKIKIEIKKDRYLPLVKNLEIQGEGVKQTLESTLLPAWSIHHIKTNPTGATIFVDGTSLGTSPLATELLQGEREIEIKLPGFTPYKQTIKSVAGAEKNHTIDLIPSPATIHIKSSPTGGALMIDNTFKGHTPVSISVSAEVEHLITIQLPGYETFSSSYHFLPEEEKSLNLKLTPELGIVYFQIEPPLAALQVDGKKQNSSNTRLKLPTKETNISVTLDGYAPHNIKITPDKSFSQNVKISLKLLEEKTSATKADKQNARETANMILVNPMSFTMGAARREAGRRANEHQVHVKLQRPFYVSKHLVTNKEYKEFKGSHSSGTVGNISLDPDSHPAVNVTWKDAVLYCNWLSKKAGIKPFYLVEGENVTISQPSNSGYRLITEAEWAYVARRHNRQKEDRYPWSGNSYPPKQLSGNYSDQAAKSILPITLQFYEDKYPTTSPVGHFPANMVGIFDLGGNVSEWCNDFYTAYITGKEVDPLGPKIGTLNVIRGSSWRDSSIAELRLSYRSYHNKAQDDVGFRVVRYAQ